MNTTMLRRLLAQFGVTALMMALGTGAVFADSTPSAAPPPSDPAHAAITTLGSSSVVVTTSQDTTTTTTGGTSIGGPGSGGSDNPPSTTPPTGSGADPTGSDTTPSTNLNLNSNGNYLSTGGATSTVTPGHGGGTSGSDSTSLAPITTLASANTLVASLQRAAYVSGLTPVEPVLAGSLATGIAQPSPPKPPPAPVGLLNQLHILLISTLVPATRFIAGGAQAAATSHLGLLVVLALVLAISASLRIAPVNSYTARLRRSGFLGAARSDVAAMLLFATPREMSSIGAGAPG